VKVQLGLIDEHDRVSMLIPGRQLVQMPKRDEHRSYSAQMPREREAVGSFTFERGEHLGEHHGGQHAPQQRCIAGPLLAGKSDGRLPVAIHGPR
jgi:hypothetical protein